MLIKIVTISIALLFTSTLCSDTMDWMYEDKSGEQPQETTVIRSECVRPIKLKLITDNRDVHRYNEELYKYSSCMTQFINTQVSLANAAKDTQSRLIHVASIKQAKKDLTSYDRLDNVDQRQRHEELANLNGLGYDEDRDKEKKKLEKMK